jgi:hypothetical protein
MPEPKPCCLETIRMHNARHDELGKPGEAGCIQCWHKETGGMAIPDDPPGEGMGIGPCPVCHHTVFEREFDLPSSSDLFT